MKRPPPVTPLLRHRRPVIRRYPIWRLHTIVPLAVLIIGLTTVLIYFLGHQSLLAETEWVLAAVSGVLFAFLSVGLFRGARIHKHDRPAGELSSVSLKDFAEYTPDWVPDIGVPDFDADDGCLGVIVAIFLSTLVLVGLALALWLLINVGLAVVVILTLAIGWVFYRALRQVFAHSRTCKGYLGRSLGYAAMYTALYTGWLLALAHLANYLLTRRA